MRRIKVAGLIISLLLVASFCGCAKKDASAPQTGQETSQATNAADDAQEYPQIAYIDNVTYYGTGEVCQMVPRKAPDGVIETFVPKEIMPDAYNSANFGEDQESIEYMFLEGDELILHVGDEWYYFEKAQDDSEGMLQ